MRKMTRVAFVMKTTHYRRYFLASSQSKTNRPTNLDAGTAHTNKKYIRLLHAGLSCVSHHE